MHENLHHYVLCLFFLLSFNSLCVNSEIQTITISSDSRAFIPLQDFGFGNHGVISLTVSSVSIVATTTSKTILNRIKLSLIGCFYAPTPAIQALKLALMKDVCLIGKPFIFPLFTFNEKIVLYNTPSRASIPVGIPDLYYIFFVNCAKNSSVSVTVNLETYNVKPNGDPDYIDDQFTALPTVLFIFALFYFCLVVTWSCLCYRSKPFVRRIHMLMAVLLLFRFLELICHANGLNSVRHSGSGHGWNILWLTMYVARSILFIIVIMLIGTGWSLFKPSLVELKKYTMAFAVVLQIVACICFILIRRIGPSDKRYRYWTVTYYAADFLCSIVMMLPVHTSMYKSDINMTEGKEARRVVHKGAFENFSVALYVYVGFTRLFLFVLRTVASYKIWCLTIALELLIELLLYMFVYLMFWPNGAYDYAFLEDRKEETSSANSPGGVDYDLKGRFLLRFFNRGYVV